MRVNISFFSLLLLATVAVGLDWANFGAARAGDPQARIIAFATAPVAFATILLLTRIIVKVDAARRSGRRS